MEDSDEGFILEDFQLFSPIATMVLIGHFIFALMCIVLIFVCVYYANFLGIIILGFFTIGMISSIKTTIMMIGNKKILFTKNELKIGYIKFEKELINESINWENIEDCILEENENDISRLKRVSLKLNLKKGTKLLGVEIKKDVAIKLKKMIDQRIQERKVVN